MPRRWREQDIPWRVAAMRKRAAAGRMVTLHRARLNLPPDPSPCVSCGDTFTETNSDPSSISGRCEPCNEAARRVAWGTG